MLDLLNASACGVLFAYCFVVAARMPGGVKMMLHKVVVWTVSITLGLGMLGPWSDWLDPPTWHGTILHACLALALIVWRKEAMAFLRWKFQIPDGEKRMRRTSDFAQLTDAEASAVMGGKG